MIKAIETVYNGYRFRSRLEARWAVFFDALSIPYEYEKEGYDLDGEWYLPDFWLPEQQYWVEIKPANFLPLQHDAIAKFWPLAHQTGHPVLLLAGDPWPDAYEGFFWSLDVRPDEACIMPARFMGCRKCDGAWLELDEGNFGGVSLNCEADCPSYTVLPAEQHSQLRNAYKAARQARFEHGE